jgi:hypothetical protein
MMISHSEDKNCISYWYPVAARLTRVPLTAIYQTDHVAILQSLDGEFTPEFKALVDWIEDAVEWFGGYPVFLRTGHTSGKHEWVKTCYFANDNKIEEHIYNLVEYSACAGVMGLPVDTWAVREFLKLDAPFTAFNGLPIGRERRLFVRDGICECVHPYWPIGAFEEEDLSGAQIDALVKDNIVTGEQRWNLVPVAERVGEALGGYWSIDFAQTVNGDWYLIDMAEGDKSYHWEDCERVR